MANPISSTATLGSPGYSVVITHNLEPEAFEWLWAKYVVSSNLGKHCTASLESHRVQAADGIRSLYSQRFSKARNPLMKQMPRLVMDECALGDFDAIYLCGVASTGYSSKRNYPHNFHAAIVPIPGMRDEYNFEKWNLKIENGVFTRIPDESELPQQFLHFPTAFTSCRIFRWAAIILPLIKMGCLINRKKWQLEHD